MRFKYKEILQKWGQYGKLYACLIILLLCALWLLRMEYRFGLEPFSKSYIDSTAFEKQLQKDVDTLSFFMDEYLSGPMNSGYVDYIESYWYPSNFKFEIMGTHSVTGATILINNTNTNSTVAKVSPQWPMYYQYREGYPIYTNLSFDLEEKWSKFDSPWLDLTSVSVYIYSFDINDTYGQTYSEYDNAIVLSYIALLVFIFFSGVLISIDFSWQYHTTHRLPWDDLYLEETICLFLLSLILIAHLTLGRSWLDIVLVAGISPLPVSLLLFSFVRQKMYGHINYSDNCWLFSRLRMDWAYQKTFALGAFFVFATLLVSGQFLFTYLNWPMHLYWILVLIILQVFLWIFRIRLDQSKLMKQINSMRAGETYTQITYRTSYYRKASALLQPLSEQIQQLVTESLKAERLKVDLITNVSHDLKTPLTSIITYIRLLEREGGLSPRSAEYLKILSNKSFRLKTLTEDLLEAARITSGSESITPQRLDFAELVLQANGEFALPLDNAGLTLVSNFEKPHLYAWIDGTKTWRILSNLYSNVAKHSLPGTRVYVDAGLSENHVWLCIKNTSRLQLNIPPDELLERFVQGDPSRSSGGNGLGLTIARELARLQNGKLEIQILGDLFMVRVELPRTEN